MIGIVLNPQINWGRNDIFKILSFTYLGLLSFYSAMFYSIQVQILYIFGQINFLQFYYLLIYFSGLLATWSLFPLGARHMVRGCQEGSRVAWMVKSRVLSTPFLLFCCFDMKEANCFCLLQPVQSLEWGRLWYGRQKGLW